MVEIIEFYENKFTQIKKQKKQAVCPMCTIEFSVHGQTPVFDLLFGSVWFCLVQAV